MEALPLPSSRTTSSQREEEVEESLHPLQLKPWDENACASPQDTTINDDDWLQISSDEDDSEEEDDRRPAPLSLQNRSTTYGNQSYKMTESGSILFDEFGQTIGCAGLRRGRGEEGGKGIDRSGGKSNLSMEDRLVTLRYVGRGACGTVTQVLDIVTWNIYALKKINIRDRKDRRQFVQELTALHEHESNGEDSRLIGFVDTFIFADGESVGLVLEFMDRGSLQVLVDGGGCEDEKFLSSTTRQCLIAFDQLHRRNHIHRDLKPANILINSSGEVKITDFGLVKTLSRATSGSSNKTDLNPAVSLGSHTSTFVGTLSYMSPERLLGQLYNYSSDIYSLGLTIMATALGKGPSSSGGYWSLITHLEDDDSKQSPSLPSDDDRWSEDFRDFLNLCLKKDPQDRPAADTLLTHKFIASHYDNHVVSEAGINCHQPTLKSTEKYTEVERILNTIVVHIAGKSIGQRREYSYDEERCANLGSSLSIDKQHVLKLCHKIWKREVEFKKV